MGVLEGLKTGKSTLVGPVVGALVGDLVGALVGPLVVSLVDPLIGRGSLSPALCVAQPSAPGQALFFWGGGPGLSGMFGCFDTCIGGAEMTIILSDNNFWTLTAP